MDKHIEFWTNKKINEMGFSEREAAVTNIFREKTGLFAVFSACSERIIKALFLMNSGGVVTLLAYLHNNPKINNNLGSSWWLSCSLQIFLLGLASAFILVTYDYLVVHYRFSKYSKQSREFLDDKIIFSKIEWFQGRPALCCQTSFYFIFVYATGAISFVCAIAGILSGLHAYQLI